MTLGGRRSAQQDFSIGRGLVPLPRRWLLILLVVSGVTAWAALQTVPAHAATLAPIVVSEVPAATGCSSSYTSQAFTTTTTWDTSCSPITVSGTITVASGVTLTVDPGTEVKFLSDAALRIDGRLSALGALTSPITFTSGVSLTTPSAGDWRSIEVPSGGRADVSHARFFYPQRAISATEATVNLNSTVISQTQQEGLVGFDARLTVNDTAIAQTGSVGIASLYNSILNPSGELTVTNSTLSQTTNRGILVMRGKANISQTTVDGVTLVAAGTGQGILGIGADLTLGNNTQVRNAAAQGVYAISDRAVDATLPLTRTSNLTITDAIIESNDSTGIYVHTDGSRAEVIANSSVLSNTGSGLNLGDAGSVNNLVVQGNARHGLILSPARLSSPSVTGNTIAGNDLYALYVFYQGGGGLPVLGGNTITGNGFDHAIGLAGQLGISQTLPLGYPEPFVVTKDLLEIAPGATLTVAPGVVVRSQTMVSGGLPGVLVNGRLSAIGTMNQPITFTSLLDPDPAPAVTGTKVSGTPAPGQWLGVGLGGSGEIEMVHGRVRYAVNGVSIFGDRPLIVHHSIIELGSGAGIYYGGPSVDLFATTIRQNSNSGAYLLTDQARVVGSSLTQNFFDGLVVYTYTAPPSVTLESSDFSSNGSNGVFLFGTSTVDARQIAATGNGSVGLLLANPVAGNTTNVFASTFLSNGVGLKVSGGTPGVAVHQSDFVANTTAALSNTVSTITVDARENFWGAASGPSHTGNPGGTGGQVSDYVDYADWLTIPAQTTPTIGDVQPVSGANDAAVTLTISGQGFVRTPAVYLDHTPISTTYVNSTTVQATVPAGFSIGTYTVTVINPVGWPYQASRANAYTATAPAIATPTATATSTATPTATAPATPTPTATATSTATTVPPTATPTSTSTATSAATATATSTATPTDTPPSTSTATATPTSTPTATDTATATPSATATTTATPSATATATITPAPISTIVDPAAGGTLSNNNGSVQVSFPPGAVAEPLAIAYAPQTPPSPPAGVVALGGFSLSAQTGDGRGVTQFNRQLTLSVRYDPAQLGGLPTSAIQIFYQNSAGQWVALATTVDSINHLATAQLDHFTPFAAFASPGGPVPPEPSSTPTATPMGTPDAGNNTICATARPLAFGETVRGYLLQPGEQRWYQITPPQVPWNVTARLLGAGPDMQALLTVNCGQGPGAQAAVPIVPIGQSTRDDQGWLVTGTLQRAGTYQVVVQAGKRGFVSPFELAVAGQPAPTPLRIFLPAIVRTASGGW